MMAPAPLEIQSRPYVGTFTATGSSYPMSSEEVRTLAAEYPIVRVTAGRLTLRADDGRNVVIQPATLGGGAAFRR